MKDREPATAAIRRNVLLKAPIQIVWAHLTEAEKLGLWFHPAERDLKTGEDYALIGADGAPLCWGRVTAMEPPRRLAYTFTVKPMNGAMSEVEWILDPFAGGTRLELIHTGLPEGEAAADLLFAMDAGWDEHIGRLRALAV
ncbi:MAG: SRPBCC domain-containing protein [Pseudomonadota bacterium]